jgi:cobalt-precorrin-5B (C1)-methyltransferase
MRTGYSTSACAAAAAAAALRALRTGSAVEQICIDLPAVKGVTFTITRCEATSDGVCCGVIKDAGDDPDVTNGLEIQAVVRRMAGNAIYLRGGTGVGRVTLPGLAVAVGEAAINPGPRKLILQAFHAELDRLQENGRDGWEITVRVPEGERVAEQTMNPKLGIVGGISILGTDGLVRPYSAPAFRTSLFYELRVALEAGYTTVGLATGKRSAAYLREALGDARGLGVLDVGDELGYPIDQAAKLGFARVAVGGMIGKLSKLAQGRFQTHVQEGEVDFDFLVDLAAKCGASAGVCAELRGMRTAHQIQNRLRAEGLALEPELARLAAEQVFARGGGRLDVSVWLFALNGERLGQADREAWGDD